MAGRQRWMTVVCVVGVGMLTTAGCDGTAEPAAAPTSAATRSVTPPVPRDLFSPRPEVVRTPQEACGGTPFRAGAVRAYTPDGPRYDGPGPHPVKLLRMESDLLGMGPELPYQWTGPRPAQLVVCEYEDETFDSRQVGTCEYLGGTVLGATARVQSARFVYRVFEARTGTLVRQFTLRGNTTPEETCPETTYAKTALYDQQVESKDLVAKIRPLVERDR
ncbi:hypothetical protein [Streptomyces formicae]|uniref:Lipoprotein n=1 Tax=Streptomyces formicae TaxID=1616117 RepID=A0ABY3WNJ1_9ACTN|nr:hypothetical protein [Streptomyces formicae]UNM12081.1 hypothetical protein J4032_11515 [Streptomyces formicae]